MIVKHLHSEFWSKSLDNFFGLESRACGLTGGKDKSIGMEASIRSWISCNPFPTWEDLMAIFRELGEYKIALKIEEIIPRSEAIKRE